MFAIIRAGAFEDIIFLRWTMCGKAVHDEDRQEEYQPKAKDIEEEHDPGKETSRIASNVLMTEQSTVKNRTGRR